MKVTFLGTGTSQGVPVIACDCDVCKSKDAHDKRLRSSVHISVNGKSFVIDSGPDFRQQMLREDITHLDGIIFTHAHKDHTAGMDDVRAYNFKQKSKIDVFATLDTQKVLKREFEYIFSDFKYPGIPEIDLITIDNNPFKAQGVTFTPIDVLHYRMPVLGFRVGDFTYITDANYIAEEERIKARGSKVLVLNALRREEHISHFTLKEALEVIEDLKPETAYLTHISHQLGKHKDVSKELPPHVHLAYDGLQIDL